MNTAFENGLSNLSNRQVTWNGDANFISTKDNLLDLFFISGTLRRELFQHESKKVLSLFENAFIENPTYAMRLLFAIRDCRGGLGVRSVFHTILNHMLANNQFLNWLSANLHLIPEYGYWKDFYAIDHTEHGGFVSSALFYMAAEFSKNDGLVAKYMPSQNQKHLRQHYNAMLKNLRLTPKQYRKILSEKRQRLDIVERKMSANDWDKINYSSVPSLAFNNYKSAFGRHDYTRFDDFLNSGRKINASVITPVELLGGAIHNDWRSIIYGDHDNQVFRAFSAQWDNLPNFMNEIENHNTSGWLPICDFSGSMGLMISKSSPRLACTALGIYFSQFNTSPFKDKILAFSRNVEYIDLSNLTVLQKVQRLEKFSDIENTDLDKVFNLILKTCLQYNAPAPNLVFLSDMQFDSGVKDTSVIERWQQEFRNVGIEFPKIVFWNLANNTNGFPITKHESGAILFSGYATNMLQNIVKSNFPSPEDMLYELLNSERYNKINVTEQN